MTTLPTIAQQQFEVIEPAVSAPAIPHPPTASEILSMLRRRTILICALSVLFSAIGMAGFLAWWYWFPGFSGDSLIECISNIPETNLNLDQQRLQEDEHDRFVLSQAMLLKSPTVLGDALKITAVKETGWYKRVSNRNREPLIELTQDLSAAPVRGTNFLRVSMETHRPEDAPIIVNEVVNLWYQMVKKRTAEEFASDALAARQNELKDIDRVISEKRDRLRDIAQRLPAGAKDNPANNIIAQQVRQYGEQVGVLQMEVALLEQYRQFYNDPEGIAVTAEDRALVEQDPQIAELARALFLYEQQRAADEKVYGAGHNAVRQIDAQIQAAQKRLEQLRLQKYREVRADMRGRVNSGYESERHSMFIAQENLAKAEAQLQDQDRLLFEYADIEAQLAQDNSYRLRLEETMRNLTRVLTLRRAINVTVAQPAVAALERSSPSLWLIPAIAIFSVALAMGLGLTLELVDTRVRTSQDIVRHLDVALLGAVPDSDDEEIAIKHIETATRDAPHSMMAEAFRRIRTNLHFSSTAERQRTVLVTSPRAEDGKTTVACNLAYAIAQSGQRVLLIDANLRRPALHTVFKGVGDRGLSNILVGDGSLAAYVTKTDSPKLDVLGSGQIPPNPAELLGSSHWKALLNEAVKTYDQVLIDSSPVLLSHESVLISTAVDGVVLVVRANRNSRGVARRACGLLGDVNARVLGVVLNAARVTRGGYFREQLRAYYDYRPEEALARRK